VGPIALQFERLLHRRLSVPQRAHAPAHQCGVAEAVIVPCVGRDRQAQVRAQQRVATRIRDLDLGRGVRHDGDVERGRRGNGFFALGPTQRPEVAAARPRCPAAREPVRLDIEPDLALTLLGHEPCVLETPGGPAADVELGPRRDLERRRVALEALSRALEVCRVHHVHHEVGDEERVQRHDPERVAGGPVRRGHPVQHRHVDAREGAHRALARHGEDPLPGHVARGARVEHHLAPARRDDPDLEVGAARDFRVPRFDDQRRQRRGREMGYWVEERRPRGPRPLRGGEREGRGHGSEHQEQDQRALAPRPRQLAELAAQLEDARVRELALQRELGAPEERTGGAGREAVRQLQHPAKAPRGKAAARFGRCGHAALIHTEDPARADEERGAGTHQREELQHQRSRARRHPQPHAAHEPRREQHGGQHRAEHARRGHQAVAAYPPRGRVDHGPEPLACRTHDTTCESA